MASMVGGRVEQGSASGSSDVEAVGNLSSIRRSTGRLPGRPVYQADLSGILQEASKNQV